ncbi:hypothetical protein Sjap_012370 [Stephania japonica]|uniref:intramembrane prenyl-peptidase Rce1 n=1 Tax=Stephania japonica TaxID=461633 RepID=A0AAP0NXJ2_9MAGN
MFLGPKTAREIEPRRTLDPIRTSTPSVARSLDRSFSRSMFTSSTETPELSLGFPSAQMEEERSVARGAVAVAACAAMAVFYVAILYAPTLVLRLPQSKSLNSFMIRRFICVSIASVVSLIFSALILPKGSWELSHLSAAYGIRADHMWQAVVYPLSLTSLMYAGSLVSKSLSLLSSWKEDEHDVSFCHVKNISQRFLDWVSSVASNVLAWRNYVVSPLTEELVFRACMIPLLLCGGFKVLSIIFLSPIFFSLAHLNHFLELYWLQNYTFLKAALIIGFQLGYTVIFGSYASFLFIRTGHLVAPLVAHIFCNTMGLPLLPSRGKGLMNVVSIAGMIGFLLLLFPATRPSMFNGKTDNCSTTILSSQLKLIFRNERLLIYPV